MGTFIISIRRIYSQFQNPCLSKPSIQNKMRQTYNAVKIIDLSVYMLYPPTDAP